MNKSAITTKLKAAILSEFTLKVAEINVDTFKGVVQLSGFVTSDAATNKAVAGTRRRREIRQERHASQVKDT